MRKLKLLLVAFALMMGWSNASAYTVGDLASDGWTKITTISQGDITDKYYVFVDENETLMLGLATSSNQSSTAAFYQAIANPALDAKKVWTLEANGGNYAMRNLYSNSRQMQTEWSGSSNDLRWRTNDQTGSISWTGLGLAYADGAWSLTSTQYTRPLGIYNNETGTPVEGKEIGANDAGKGQKFQIYAISRDAYWALAASLATTADPVISMTGAISNQEIYNGNKGQLPRGWSEDTSIRETGNNNRTAGTGVTVLEAWSGGNPLKAHYYQNITNLPDGVYRLKAKGQDQSGNGGGNIYISNGTSEKKVTFGTSAADVETDNIISDGSLTIGMRADGNASWVNATDFRLIYIGKVIRQSAINLPANGAMSAGAWYKYTVAVTGEYTITATTAANIIQTDDGEQLAETGTGSVVTTGVDVALTAGDIIYYKSSSDNTLTIEANVKTYELGAITAQNIANGNYIGSLTTLVLTYGDAATNDGDASLAVIGSATATLKKGSSTITTGTLTANNAAKTLTATFTSVDLEQDADDYSIVIPAGAFGYEGQSVNSEVTVTFNTGVIADGTYFIKKYGENKFITRGGNYGTETVTDNFGIAFETTIQSNGSYILKNIEHSLSANTNKYLGEYTDANSPYYWTFVETTNGYYMKNSEGKYLTTTEFAYTDAQKNTNSYYYKSFADNEASAIVWNVLTKSEYTTALSDRKDAEIAAIAASAGMSATTLVAFESALSSGFGATDVTSSITNPTVITNMDGWTKVHYADNAQADPNANGTCAEIWNGQAGVKQTISSLAEGLYKITVNATWRPGTKDAATRVAENANTTAWIYANGNYTQLKSWYDGGATINSRADLVSNQANYLNTVYVYVTDGEDLTIGLASPSYCVQPWLPFINWTLTRYEVKPTTEEKKDLADAITAAEAKTLGFENGEYAPYNNVDALTKLATAKAINPETASGAAVVAATTALTGATWTANVGEVNAIYDGDFAIQDEHTTGPTALAGWNNPEGIRQLIKNTETDPGLSSASAQAAVFAWGNTTMTYGDVTGYTIPLKANTVYELSFKTCGWRDGDMGYVKVTLLNTDSEGMPEQTTATATKRVNVANPWDEFSIVFVTGKAGNYKLGMWTSKHTVFTDLLLKKAASQVLEFADGSSLPKYAPGTYPSVKITRTLTADRWATAVYPFAVSKSADLKIATLDSYNKATGALGFAAPAASTANVPFLMRSTAGATEISLSDVAVAAASATDATADEASLKGVYNSTAITNEAKNYVLSNNKIYPVGDAGATINPYRAYIQVAQDALARLSFFIEGEETTGIDNLTPAISEGEGALYNLNGQKVQNAKKGVFIQNGRKIVIR